MKCWSSDVLGSRIKRVLKHQSRALTVMPHTPAAPAPSRPFAQRITHIHLLYTLPSGEKRTHSHSVICILPSFSHIFSSLSSSSVSLATAAVMTSFMNHRQIFKDFLPTYISLSDSPPLYSFPLHLFSFFYLDYGRLKLSMFRLRVDGEPKYSQSVTGNVRQPSPCFFFTATSLCACWL